MNTLVTMTQLVEDFAKENPACFHAGQCRDRCDYFSTVFMDRIHENTNLPASLVQGFMFMEVDGHRVILEGHVATLVNNDTVFDWTARQFDPKAPVPVIQPLSEWRETWKEI